ncbi:hypothetical protein GCM10010344_79250 [Streptomyces bluensis]|nr:hypothetical protein GCM10010344_79250 [Streptomyces bluensis]
MAEDQCHLAPYEVQQHLAPFHLVQTGEPLEQTARRDHPTPRAHQPPQHRGHVTAITDRAQVEREGKDDGRAVGQCGVEQCEPLLRGHGGEAGAGEAFAFGGGEVAGHAGAVEVPRPPYEGRGGQSEGAAVLREGVEEGVGGGVVGLSCAPEGTGGGGDEDEGPDVGQEFVQVPRRVCLGPQDGVQSLGGQAADKPVVEYARGVDDGRDVSPCQYGGEGVGQRVTVGDVAGRHVDPVRPQLRQLGDEFVGARCVRAPPRQQHQLAHTVRAHEMPGQDRAEAAGTTGHEDRARAGPEVCRRVCGCGRPHDPGGFQPAFAYGGFGLVEGQGPAKQVEVGVGVGVGVGVDLVSRRPGQQADAPGVFVLHRAEQAAYGTEDRLGHACGGHDEAGVGVPLLVEPLLNEP